MSRHVRHSAHCSSDVGVASLPRIDVAPLRLPTVSDRAVAAIRLRRRRFKRPRSVTIAARQRWRARLQMQRQARRDAFVRCLLCHMVCTLFAGIPDLHFDHGWQ